MVDKITIGLTSVCIVLLAVCSLMSVLHSQNLNELQLKSDEVSQIENDKAILEAQLASANNETSQLESQISDLQSKLSDSETDKTALNSQVSSLQSDNTALGNELTQKYDEGYEDGEAEGYQEGVVDGAGSGYNIRDPTYAEAVAFIASDQTDKNGDDSGEYVLYVTGADRREKGRSSV